MTHMVGTAALVAAATAAATSDQCFLAGIAYPSWWNGNYATASSTASLKELASTNANMVSISPTHFMSSASDSAIFANQQTESDANVVKAIQDAEADGLGVMLKPHIDATDWSFRGFIAPADAQTWFANYKAMMLDYAHIAADNGVQILSIGTELQSLTGPQYRSEWVDIIDSIRAVYHGQLTYSAYVGEASTLSFWDKLDYVGVDLYPPLSTSSNPTVQDLVAAWKQPSPDPNYDVNLLGGKSPYDFLHDLSTTTGKPLLLTEIGFESAQGAATASPNPAVADPQAQADLYQAFFQFWQHNAGDWMKGAFVWDWTPVKEASGAGFGIQGMPAQALLSRWLGPGRAHCAQVARKEDKRDRH